MPLADKRRAASKQTVVIKGRTGDEGCEIGAKELGDDGYGRETGRGKLWFLTSGSC